MQQTSYAEDIFKTKRSRLQSMEYPLLSEPKHLQSLKLLTSNSLGGDAFIRKYIISLLTLTLGQGQTRKVAQYPLHHMTYAPAKFEAGMSNGLGGNAFT